MIFETKRKKMKFILSLILVILVSGCSTQIPYVAKPVKDIRAAISTVEEFLLTQYHQPSRPEKFEFEDEYMNIVMPTTISKSRMPSYGKNKLIINNNTYRIYYKNVKGLMLSEKNGKFLVQPICKHKCYQLKYYTDSEKDAEFFYDSFVAVINFAKKPYSKNH